eukprot:SAG31_NODE_21538_length_547_cov_0.633929_1_plen_143_part_10
MQSVLQELCGMRGARFGVLGTLALRTSRRPAAAGGATSARVRRGWRDDRMAPRAGSRGLNLEPSCARAAAQPDEHRTSADPYWTLYSAIDLQTDADRVRLAVFLDRLRAATVASNVGNTSVESTSTAAHTAGISPFDRKTAPG